MQNALLRSSGSAEAVRSAEDTGKKQFQKFHEDRISSSATAFNDNTQEQSSSAEFWFRKEIKDPFKDFQHPE